MTGFFAPLADGVLAWASLGDGMLVASAVVAFAVHGLPPVLSCFAVAGTRGASADIHGIGIGRVLLEQEGLVRARGF